MYSTSSYYEDEFLDDDDYTFEKISRKGKNTKHNKKDAIREQRQIREKQREKELYDLNKED